MKKSDEEKGLKYCVLIIVLLNMKLKPLVANTSKGYCSSLLMIVLGLFTMTISLNAQDLKFVPKGMHTDDGNFSSFNQPRKTATTEQWALFNENRNLQHPEFGYLPVGGPDADVVEILSKRTANERFFINAERPSEFYKQTSYGPMHFMVNGEWLSINPNLQPVQNGIYEATNQPEPVGFNVSQKHSYIKTIHGKASFNNWSLFGVKNGQEQLLAQANWSNYIAGDDGLYITEVFPGMDLRMRLFQGAIKSEFLVKELLFDSIDYLLFKDTFDPNGLIKQTDSTPAEYFNSAGTSLLTLGEALIYPMNSPKEEMIISDYQIKNNHVGIVVPFNWISQKIAQGMVVIDPLVTSTNTLAQAAITGSQYNASCDFTNSCNYNLSINPPANATITNAFTNFNYLAAGACWLEDGATRFSAGGCTSPNQAGYYWFCNGTGGGTCNGNNIEIGGDLTSCMPPPACAAQIVPMQFTLQFFRSCYGTAGCTSGCISAGSAWSVTIQGRTLEYASNNPNQQLTLSATSVCPGGIVTATSAGIQNGVPPYTINWSLNASGIPSVGTGNSVPITLSNIGANTIYCNVTDACGTVINSNRNVTVTAPPAGPSVTTPVNYCLNETAAALTSPGITPQWYVAQIGGSPITAPTPSTGSLGTTTYWVSQMVGACESLRSQLDVIVHPLPVISGTAVITPSACAGSTGSITGMTSSGPAPITYTWSDGTGTVLSSSTTTSDLLNQPAGQYTLTVTDAQGCEDSQSGFTIDNENSPNAPIVVTPLDYCQNETALVLTATGANLLWYTTAAGGTGSAAAPLPSTAAPGTTTFYVSQTNNGCESLRSAINVEVIATPIVPSVTTPLRSCQNSTPGTLQATGNSLLWYTAPTGGTGSASTPVISTATGGNQFYYVSQTVNTCESARSLVTVEIIPLTTFSGTPIIVPSNCGQSTGSITGINVAGGSNTLTTFTWTNSSGTQVGTTLILNNQPAGTYTLTATDQDQCAASHGPFNIPLANPPAPPAAVSPVEFCQSSTAIALSATGASILWYTTATGGAGSTTAPTPITTTVGSTSYFATQTVNGCESPRKEIIVNITDSPGAEFALTNQTGCAPYCVTFQNLSTPTGAPLVSYQWTSNGEEFSTEAAPNECFTSGTYEISLLITDAIGCSRQITKTNFLIVVPAPVAGFSSSRPEAPEEDPLIVFTTTNPRADQIVVWNFGDTTTDTAYISAHNFPEAGTYCVNQTVSDMYGCSDREEQCITITSDFYLYIPNSFTPNADGINDTWLPSIKGKFTSYRLSIFNRWGDMVFNTTDEAVPWVGEIQSGDYYYAQDGMYHFVIVLEDINKNPKEYRGHIQVLR